MSCLTSLLLAVVFGAALSSSMSAYNMTVKTGKCLDLSTMPKSELGAGKGFSRTPVVTSSHCALLCNGKASCVAWSLKEGVCNVSHIAEVRLIQDDKCEYWSKMDELSIIAYYRLNNEARGFNFAAVDDSLNAEESIVNTTFTSDAVDILGNNGGLNTTQISTLNVTSFSASLWIKPRNTTDRQVVFESGDEGIPETGYQVWLWRTASSVLFAPKYSPYLHKHIETVSGTVKPDQWNFLAVAANQTHGFIFYDGVRITDFVLNQPINVGDMNIYFGRSFLIGATVVQRTTGDDKNFFGGQLKCMTMSEKMYDEEMLREIRQLC